MRERRTTKTLQPFIALQAIKAHRPTSVWGEERPVKLIYSCCIGLGLVAPSSASLAQMQAPGWQAPGGGGYDYVEPPGVRDPREGKVEVQTFVANSPRIAELGHGPIAIAPSGRAVGAAGTAIDSNGNDGLFETALASRLAAAGYQTGASGPGQTVDYVVSRALIQPPEPPHSPVHGAVGVGAGNRGSGMGLGIMIDLSKPLGALVATRIEAHISDAATHELLWQGRAEVMARENDRHWRPEMIADRLTAALFKAFPRPTGR